MPHASSFSLTGPLFATNAMRAVFSDRGLIQRMLDFEAALARAQGRHGVIPASAVAGIVACCDAWRIDASSLGEAAAAAGNLAIPLVKQLTAVVREEDEEAAKFVHWGATSQDVLDTALMLQLQEALPFLRSDLQRLADTLAALALKHKDTVMAGRTWMQHALPITFGLKVAGWLAAVGRHQDNLQRLEGELWLQLGGAAGTLASLGEAGPAVAQSMAADLKLKLADTPWHAERERIGQVATTLGLLVGSLGKMARDISLLMQTEIAELAEPVAAGRGGSSAMPHKRNPVGCALVLTAAVRVPGLVATILSGMVQENERALGGWQAEWDTLPEIVLFTAGALQQMGDVCAGLEVDAKKMRVNLDATRGQLMAEAVTLALGAQLGKERAHELVEAACRALQDQRNESYSHLRDTLLADPQIGALINAADVDRLLDPARYTGQSAVYVDQVLQAHQRRKANSLQE